LRLFTPVGSNITEALFFIPGFMGKFPATVRGFGAVFTDVDEPNGVGSLLRRGNPRMASTLIEYFDQNGNLILAVSFPPRPVTGAFPSSASCLRKRVLHGSGSQPVTFLRGLMMIMQPTILL